MRNITLGLFSVLLFSGITAAQPGPDRAAPDDLVIQVAPQTIVLDRDAKSGNVWVTIHAEIDFSRYYVVSVQLDNDDGTVIDAEFTFADNRGDLVAKFMYDEVAEELGPGPATLTLFVENGSTTFSGSDDIRVIAR
jgi:hypothetical protein